MLITRLKPCLGAEKKGLDTLLEVWEISQQLIKRLHTHPRHNRLLDASHLGATERRGGEIIYILQASSVWIRQNSDLLLHPSAQLKGKKWLEHKVL